MNLLQQTSPDVWFTQTWVVTLAVDDGRITLAPGRLKTVHSGIETVHAIESVAETQTILRDRFAMSGLNLPEGFPISR
jgi:arylamine N-acetyltransferase